MGIGRMIGAVSLMAALFGGTHFYIGRRAFQWLRLLFPQINGTSFIIVMVFLVLSMVLGQTELPQPFKGIFGWIGSYWMGIFIYLLLFFLFTDAIVLLGRLFRIIPAPAPHDVRFWAGLAAVVLSACFVAYGIYNANQIKTVNYEIKTKRASAPLDFKIVLISDLHLGEVNSEKGLENTVQIINRLKPDLVCIAGDIFNHNYNAIRSPARAIALFKSIESKYGVFACLGNHDSGNTFNQLLGLLEQSNVRLLNDEHITIDGRLVLAGRVDPSPIGGFGELFRKDTAEVIAAITEKNMPVVIMDHSPARIDEYGEEVDLVLSGHTHKGQIFPGNLFTRALYTVDYGHYQKDSSHPHVIVTSGAGTWGMPIRTGTNSEVAEIILR